MAKVLKVGGFDVLESESELTCHDAVVWAKKANADSVGGFSDWVLPDRLTLTALAFIRPSKDWYWSSSTSIYGSNGGFIVGSDGGNVALVRGYIKDGASQVLLVRAEQMFEICRAGQLESMRQSGISYEEKSCSL